MSLNTVSVRLTHEFGPTAVAKTAYRLGIASKLDPNPSLALGTSEVSLIELVVRLRAVRQRRQRDRALRGRARAHHRRQDRSTSARRTISAASSSRATSAMMNTMMRETLRIGTAQRAQLPGWPAAGKTGTSQDFRDAWFVGYTAHLVTGVWLGNDDSSPTKKATGGGLPVEIWSRIMKVAHQGIAVAALPGVGLGWRADHRPRALCRQRSQQPDRRDGAASVRPFHRRDRRPPGAASAAADGNIDGWLHRSIVRAALS